MSCDCQHDFLVTGPVLLLPMQKGTASRWSRAGHGWATTAGVLDGDGQLIRTKDRQGEFMVAAEHPDGIDFQDLVPYGFMNDSHRSVPAKGTTCAGGCQPGKPIRSCPVHGGKQVAVMVGIPDQIEYVGAQHPLASRDGKVGWYSHFHIFDPTDVSSWKNPDGSDRMRMLRDGSRTDEPFAPTREELDRSDWFWQNGLKMQREGRPLGQSIQGTETAIPCEGGKCIVRAKSHQIALIEYPHNPDATVEALGTEMTKGLPPIVAVLAERLMTDPRYGVTSLPAASKAAAATLKRLGIFNE